MTTPGPVAATAKTTPKKVPVVNTPKLAQSGGASESLINKAKAFAASAKSVSVAAAKDPKVQVSAASAAAGTVVLGACGGVVGLVAGGAVGLPFALFTLGLSIPISAAIGAGAGVAVGGATGCATGGASGYSVYRWRKEIKAFIDRSWSKATATTEATKSYLQRKISSFVSSTKTNFAHYKRTVTDQVKKFIADVERRSSPVTQKVKTVVKDPHAQTTAASAAAGGIAVGVPCGTIGFVAGGAIGFLPAIFTFGLSVPVFAVVGGGAGLCVGGATGALGGGAAGYGAYAKKSEIRQGASNAVAYVKKMVGRQ